MAKRTTREEIFPLSCYEAEIELIEPLLGATPKSKDIYEDHILAKAKEMGLEAEGELEDVEEIEEKGWISDR